MPSITAKRKCPELIFVKPRFDAYKAISLQIREIFAAYTPIIEPLSLDEGYLDVLRPIYGPDYYAALIIDPDGYRVEAYYGPAET